MTTVAAYTLIGDLTGSGREHDRGHAHGRLGKVLAEVTERLQPVQPLEPTGGDEFLGAFTGLPDATLAALLVRLGRSRSSTYGVGSATGR